MRALLMIALMFSMIGCVDYNWVHTSHLGADTYVSVCNHDYDCWEAAYDTCHTYYRDQITHEVYMVKDFVQDGKRYLIYECVPSPRTPTCQSGYQPCTVNGRFGYQPACCEKSQ